MVMYNEINKYMAQWLRNLIAAGLIADGVVWECSIEDIKPEDLNEFDQCHFFAGLGGWSLALRAAGVPDDYRVWSASCPCQPFSAAGAGAGFADERHLWPTVEHLARECRPARLIGEQVASKDAEPWLDLVQDDMEALGYAFGAVAFPSAGVGAPHIRDRTYWVADSAGAGPHGQLGHGLEPARRATGGGSMRLADSQLQQRSDGQRRIGFVDEARGRDEGAAAPAGLCGPGGLAYARHDYDAGQSEAAGDGQSQADRSADKPGRRGASPERMGNPAGATGKRDTGGVPRTETEVDSQGFADGRLAIGLEHAGESLGAGAAGPTNGFWRAADWLGCRDGKWRPVEPGTFPLAHGLPVSLGKLSAGERRLAEVAGLDAASLKRAKGYRTGVLSGAGNAINVEAARIFIECAFGSVGPAVDDLSDLI